MRKTTLLTCGGMLDREIASTPVAIIDFETTGLCAGPDRVVEVSVVRCEAGRAPELVLDTLVHPGRPVSASWIHGITDADVSDAPPFAAIADPFLEAIAGCAVAAYNVSFDIRFFEYELMRASRPYLAPHFCLMYLRPMLGLGLRGSLAQVCHWNGFGLGHAHRASADALAAARLWEIYRNQIAEREIRTFRELGALKRYKFVESFARVPLFPPSARIPHSSTVRLKSRTKSLL